MKQRRVLCEGPEDLAVLREIAMRFFHAKTLRTPTAPPAGLDRHARIELPSGDAVTITACSGAKSGLPASAASSLQILPPAHDHERLLVVFDPDGDAPEAFCADLHEAITSAAPDWVLEAREGDPGCWDARRAEDPAVMVAGVPWCSIAPRLDDLADTQSLERLVVDVARRTVPKDHIAAVERWLDEIRSLRGRPPSWKAAVHLLSALCEPKAPGHAPAQRFLGGSKTFRAHVEPALKDAQCFGQSLFDRLGLLFGPT